MTIIAFLYEHWFKTIILALFAATPGPRGAWRAGACHLQARAIAMTFDSDGRDLAYQAERLAADKRDDRQILAADLVVAGLIGLIVASVVWSFITWVSQ